jgi:hypothetical protein
VADIPNVTLKLSDTFHYIRTCSSLEEAHSDSSFHIMTKDELPASGVTLLPYISFPINDVYSMLNS